MLFNSLQFVGFFIAVYLLYLMLNHRYQNRFLLLASYVFYGSWNWKFLSLILISTVVDYWCALQIQKQEVRSKQKLFLTVSVATNLGILGFFKYFNFFIENVEAFFPVLGMTFEASRLDVILPVGISFYTFQTMSYTIEVFRGKLKPEKNFLDFALYVAFFPQLVAGPIERASRLLPQIKQPRSIGGDQLREGMFLIVWGYYKKVFIADNLAQIVNRVFTLPAAEQSGIEIVLGIYAFAFQIYCDFSGYTDIARGVSKLMGFNLMVNFNLPYFAKNPAEFWHRWHISLSTWLRDYLYISLGGNRKGEVRTYINLALTMLLGGLWHGAAWTFVVWGAYQGAILIVHRYFKDKVPRFNFQSDTLSALKSLLQIVFMFQVVCVGWLVFRAESLPQIWQMLWQMFSDFTLNEQCWLYVRHLGFYTVFLLMFQIFQYHRDDLLVVNALPRLARGYVWVLLIISIIYLGNYGGTEFIYFQF